MRLLQRYVLSELLRVFASLLSVLTVLLVFVGVFREVTESGLGPLQALHILPFVVPSLLPFTIPATLLLTVSVVYGRLAGDQEITAAKAAGVNILSLLWPAWLLGIVLSVASMVLADQIIPWAVGNIQRIVTSAMEDIFLDMLRTHHQVTDTNRGFAITVMGIDGKKLVMPTFKYNPPGKNEVTLQAQEAHLEFDLEHRQVIVHLLRGHVDIPGERSVWFEREAKPFPLPNQISQPKPRHMSVRLLRSRLKETGERIDRIRKRRDVETALVFAHGDLSRVFQPSFVHYEDNFRDDHGDHRRLRTEMHGRFALSTSCLFFVFVGAPVAILQARRQFLTAFMVCFVPILVGYYPLVLGMMNLSKTGTVDPAWAMWLGNAVLTVFAVYFLRRVLRH